MNQPPIDFDRLLKLRLVVARLGEMDSAKWWNTKGQLGRMGTSVVRRGFPRTHYFAQARSVFAVAAQRCKEVFDPPECVTLWRLPEEIEAEFDARWEHWLDNSADWTAFFQSIETIEISNLSDLLCKMELVNDSETAALSKIRKSADSRAVSLVDAFTGSREDIALLALGFAKGDVGSLVVPYARNQIS